MTATGHIDLISRDLIEGWLHLPDGEPATLEIFHGPHCIGTCRADRHRADLQAAGHGDGNCAFSFLIPLPATLREPAPIRLRLSGTPLYLLPTEGTRIVAARLWRGIA